jgi:predicted transcriptional regulator
MQSKTLSKPLANLVQDEKQHALTLEAIADVDSGRVIDHEAVQAWVDSLDPERKPHQS